MKNETGEVCESDIREEYGVFNCINIFLHETTWNLLQYRGINHIPYSYSEKHEYLYRSIALSNVNTGLERPTRLHFAVNSRVILNTSLWTCTLKWIINSWNTTLRIASNTRWLWDKQYKHVQWNTRSLCKYVIAWICEYNAITDWTCGLH